MANTLKLPAEGRQGKTPPWPLGGVPSRNERALWARLWRTPMAVAWEAEGLNLAVARYVVIELLAESALRMDEEDEDEDGAKTRNRLLRAAGTAMLAEARQLEDRLGLTPMARLRLRWEILPPAERAPVVAHPTRRRLRVADE